MTGGAAGSGVDPQQPTVQAGAQVGAQAPGQVPITGAGAGTGICICIGGMFTTLIGGGGAAPQQPVKTDFYTVKAGDTLSKISKMTGKSIRDIMNKNRITNPNRISVGQRLSI